MKKNYSSPSTEEVQLLTNSSLMNILPSSTTGAGSSDEEKGDGEIEDLAGRNRGEWGNVWGK